MGPRNPALPGAASMAAADAIDEVERLPQLFLFGLQHVLVMYAGTVAVPLILGSALQLHTQAGNCADQRRSVHLRLGNPAANPGLVEVWSTSSSHPGLFLHLRCAHDFDR